MADVRSSTQQLDTIRSVLDSRGFDSSHVQPYTGLHLNASGKQTLSSLLTRFEVRSVCEATVKSNDDSFFHNQHHRFPFLFEGDIVLTTPSLESLRLTSEPRYPYRAMLSARRSNELDQHTLLYDSLEDRRYQSLAIKRPIVHHVARIFHERCKTTNEWLVSLALFSSRPGGTVTRRIPASIGERSTSSSGSNDGLPTLQ